MTSEQSKQLVGRIWQAFANGDFKEVFDHLDDEIEWLAPETSPMSRALGNSNQLSGKPAIIQLVLSDIGKVFPQGVQMEVRNLYGDGDTVITELTNRGVLRNGRPYENKYCLVAELKKGKVYRIREYLDTKKFHDLLFE